MSFPTSKEKTEYNSLSIDEVPGKYYKVYQKVHTATVLPALLLANAFSHISHYLDNQSLVV